MDYEREFYDINGNIVVDETPDILAKKVKNVETGNFRYFVKSFGGLLMDPHGPYVNIKTQIKKADYVKVTLAAFELYVQYLRTKAQAKLRQAQRVM